MVLLTWYPMILVCELTSLEDWVPGDVIMQRYPIFNPVTMTWKILNAFSVLMLILCGLVSPNGDTVLGQHWHRKWLVV